MGLIGLVCFTCAEQGVETGHAIQIRVRENPPAHQLNGLPKLNRESCEPERAAPGSRRKCLREQAGGLGWRAGQNLCYALRPGRKDGEFLDV
jgi:hypothetical protein